MSQVWERQPNEPETPWKAFQAYRDTPGRTLQSSGLPLPDAIRYAKEHSWISRARAYDEHLDSIRLAEREDAVRQAERDTAQTIVTAASMGALAAANAIRAILAAQAQGDGSAMTLRPGEATKLLSESVKAWRLMHGESTENTKVSVADLSTDELEALIKRLGD